MSIARSPGVLLVLTLLASALVPVGPATASVGAALVAPLAVGPVATAPAVSAQAASSDQFTESPGSRFTVAAPRRVMSPTVVPGGTAHVLTLSGVPQGATAVAINVAVTRVAVSTAVTVCPGGTPLQDCRRTNTVNATAGQTISNHVTVALGGPNRNQLLVTSTLGTPTVVADLQGWYGVEGAAYVPAGPARVMPGRVLGALVAHTLTLPDVPAGATAVKLNVAATRVKQSTAVTVCPGGTALDTCRRTNSVNATAGQTVSNHVTVGLGGPHGNQVTLYVTVGSPTVVADLQGWFLRGGAVYAPAPPQRVLTGRVVDGGTAYTLALADVPSDAVAVALNVAVTRVRTSTAVTVCPGGTALAVCRATNTVNVTAGQTVANHVVVGLGGTEHDTVTFVVQHGAPTLVADLQGWFRGARGVMEIDGPSLVLHDAAARLVPRVLVERVPANTHFSVHLAEAVYLGAAVRAVGPGGFSTGTAGISYNDLNDSLEVFARDAGTYELVVTASNRATGDVTLTVTTPLIAPPRSIDAAAVAVPGGRPGQATLVPLGVVQAGTRFSVTRVSGGPGRSYVDVTASPDQIGFWRLGAYRPTDVEHVEARVDGPLWLRLRGATANVTLSVSPQLRTDGAVGGDPVMLRPTRPGQETAVALGHLVAGTQLEIATSDLPYGHVVELVGDAGSVTVPRNTGPGSAIDGSTVIVPADGAYSVRLRARNYGPTLTTLWVSTPLRARVDVDAPTLRLALRPGQSARFAVEDGPVGPGSPVSAQVELDGELDSASLALRSAGGTDVDATTQGRLHWSAGEHGALELVVMPDGHSTTPQLSVGVSTPVRVPSGLGAAPVELSSDVLGRSAVVSLGHLAAGTLFSVDVASDATAAPSWGVRRAGGTSTPLLWPSGVRVVEAAGEYEVVVQPRRTLTSTRVLATAVTGPTGQVDGDPAHLDVTRPSQVLVHELGEVPTGTELDVLVEPADGLSHPSLVVLDRDGRNSGYWSDSDGRPGTIRTYRSGSALLHATMPASAAGAVDVWVSTPDTGAAEVGSTVRTEISRPGRSWHTTIVLAGESDYRLQVTADHPSSVEVRSHTGYQPPVAVDGSFRSYAPGTYTVVVRPTQRALGAAALQVSAATNG
jgi:hypothetical protein